MAKTVNPNLKIKSKPLKSVDNYLLGIRSGDRYTLSEALTLIESQNESQRQLGDSILSKLKSQTTDSKTIRIGITGSPGAGKSTFIETLGKSLIDRGHRVAVLAIDPSSTKSQGSVLGDKTRMNELSLNDSAFVRPTATRNVLGGVARSTKESIALCEEAGYDIILIESVGVGQSETVLADLVDIYLLLLLPGGGDGVQGIKRGVVELADMLVINKYDGDRLSIAKLSREDFASSIRLFYHRIMQWRVPVLLASSIENTGFSTVIETIFDFKKLAIETDSFYSNRQEQDEKWLTQQIKAHIISQVEQNIHYENTQFSNSDVSLFEKITTARIQIDKQLNIK